MSTDTRGKEIEALRAEIQRLNKVIREYEQERQDMATAFKRLLS